MRFKAGGAEIPYTEFSLRESFDMDWSVLRLKAPIGVNGIISCDLGELATIDVLYDQGLYTMTAIPKLIVEKNQGMLPWFKPGVPKTLKQVCAFYGIPVAYRNDTPEQMWEFPEMKITEFLQRMRWCINTGTAPVTTVIANNALLVIDLAETLGVGPESGNMGELANLEWMTGQDLRIPQSCTVHVFPVTADPYDEELKGDADHGATEVQAFVTNEALIYQPSLKIKNMQGVAKYTSAKIKLTSQHEKSPVLGTRYEYDGKAMVVTEVEVTHKNTIITLSANAY